ncbi:hypothetical protein D3C85_912920 [compost metagenome]
MGGVDPVAAGIEGHARSVQYVCRPTEITARQRNLGLGHYAARAGHGLGLAEGTRRTFEQCLGPFEITELGHADSPQRQRRRVVAQGHKVQRGKRIAGCQCARRRRDQGIHRNRSSGITPSVRCYGLPPSFFTASIQAGSRRGCSGSRPCASMAALCWSISCTIWLRALELASNWCIWVTPR